MYQIMENDLLKIILKCFGSSIKDYILNQENLRNDEKLMSNNLNENKNDGKNIEKNDNKQCEKFILNKLIFELVPEKISNSFDISTNISLVLSKIVKSNPMLIAEKILDEVKQINYIVKCEVVKPGFINIKLDDKILFQTIADIINNNDVSLIKNIGNGEKVNIEFCSANPTGPLHIGHARGVFFGDVLSRLLEKSGYKVCREYYINDAGGQMEKLEKSIQWRINGCVGELPEGCYAGEYLQKIAEERKKVLKKYPNKKWSKTETANDMIKYFIKPTLDKIKINFNQWSSEQVLKDNSMIEKSIDYLKDIGLIYRGVLQQPKGKQIEDYEPREQLLFKSSEFGDDTDRPLAKSDGSHTYFASDIAYHYDKWKRGYNNMVVILGADHKGYVKRLTSAVKAISRRKAEVNIKLCELVNFIKDGVNVKMSKRKNNFLTIDDVLNEINPDILRFMILTRKADTIINFDIEKSKEQSKNNPIWYIHYANARCNSVLTKAEDVLKLKEYKENNNFSYNLSNNFHKFVVFLMFYTRFLELSVKNYEPYFFVNYLIQLATMFHSLWEKEKIIEEQNDLASFYKLSVVKATKIIIKQSLNVLGVEEIEKM